MITEHTDLSAFEDLDPLKMAEVRPNDFWDIIRDLSSINIEILNNTWIEFYRDRFMKSLEELNIGHQNQGTEFDASHSPYELLEKEKVTIPFLINCKRFGISYVAIRAKSDNVISKDFSDDFVKFSVFSDEVRYNGWPAIWQAVDTTKGLTKSCGNSHQAQINKQGYSGVYDLTGMKLDCHELLEESDARS